MIEILIRFLLLCLFTYTAWILQNYFKSEYNFLFIPLIGSFFFFFSKYATGSNFMVRLHYISTGTPAFVWKLFGVACWILFLFLIIKV